MSNPLINSQNSQTNGISFGEFMNKFKQFSGNPMQMLGNTRRYDYARGDNESMRRGDGRRSYAPRRRDAMGRYTTRYTRDDAREDMIADLHEVMSGTHDEKLKNEVKKFIEKVENM